MPISQKSIEPCAGDQQLSWYPPLGVQSNENEELYKRRLFAAGTVPRGV
jgi:hypothetical protein